MKKWVKNLKKGDVFLWGPNETPRVVLEVHGKKRMWIFLTIRRCSWTTRPYTLYRDYDVAKMAKPAPLKRKVLRAPIYKSIIHSIGALNANECEVSCCDVVGLP